MIPTDRYRQSTNRMMQNRIVIAMGVVGLLAVILVVRLADIQIVQHQRFSTDAQHNRINVVPLPSVRGLIRDRNGAVLAENFRAYNLQIVPNQVKDMDFLLDELGKLVKLSEYDLQRFRELLVRRPSFERQTLRTNLSEEEAARIALNQHRYPGIELRANLQRSYPEGVLTAHTLGYVGRISPGDLAVIDRNAYQGFEYIGRSGVEQHYEAILRGKAGFEQVETDAHGRTVRTLTQTAPKTGQNIHLSIDIELQRKSQEALKGYEGAIVALEPKTGEVLAFVSEPSFNPNLFVNGISNDDYAELQAADGQPLLNRALYGRYSPGSTLKSFMLLAGLENGLNPHETIVCEGKFQLPDVTHQYRDWKPEGHGTVNAHDSLVQSCDVYFYQLANALGIDHIHESLSRFGFGKQTEVDLPLEPSGLLPSRAWKKRAHRQSWFPGETIITGIGQGYVLVTPLQLAASTAMLANRGLRVAPRFFAAAEDPQTLTKQIIPPNVIGMEELKDNYSYDYVIDGMREVVHGPKGTARGSGYHLRYKMAGKTGTAQVKSIPQDETYVEEEVEKKFRDHSLFIAFAPLDDPKIAIAVVVEHAGSGSRTAAPIARKLMDYYLIERLGMFKTASNVVTAE